MKHEFKTKQTKSDSYETTNEYDSFDEDFGESDDFGQSDDFVPKSIPVPFNKDGKKLVNEDKKKGIQT
jgi:hypothetical protein